MFVEDPGAANFIAPLREPLTRAGWSVEVFVAGRAVEVFAGWGGETRPWSEVTSAGDLLQEQKPVIVLVGSSENMDTPGFELIRAAHEAGRTSIGVVDARGNAEYRFRGRGAGPLACAPDWLLVPDQWTHDAFVQLGFPAARSVVCGRPHHDHVITVGAKMAREGWPSVRRRAYGVGLEKVVILFVSEGSERCRRLAQSPWRDRYTLKGDERGGGRTEIALAECLIAVEGIVPRPHVVLRPHPKDVSGDFGPYLAQIDSVATDGDPLELVYGADLVVGATTSLLVEAALLGTPVLSILPCQEEAAWLPTLPDGSEIRHASTRSAVGEALRKLLQRAGRGERVCQRPIGAIQRVLEALEVIHQGAGVSH
jgi:hypothetical protein